MSNDHLILDGKGVFLQQLTRFKYGHKVGYKVQCEYDGMPAPVFEDFWELEDMLVAAGYPQPNRNPSAITEYPDVEVYLEAHGNSYRVSAVVAKFGIKHTHTREQVTEAAKAKRENRAMTLKHASFADLSISEQIGATQEQKKQEREAARWGNGVALHQYQRTNPYALIEVNGEFQLVKHERKAAA